MSRRRPTSSRPRARSTTPPPNVDPVIVVDSPRELPPAAARAWRSSAKFARTARPYETAQWEGGSPVLVVSRSTPDVLERAVADMLQSVHLGSRHHPVLLMRPVQTAWTLLDRAQRGGDLYRRLHGLGGLGVLQLVCNVLAGQRPSRPAVTALWVSIRDFTRTWLTERHSDEVPDSVRTLMRRMVTGTVSDGELAEALGLVLSEGPPRVRSRPPGVPPGEPELLPILRPVPSKRSRKRHSRKRPSGQSSGSAAIISISPPKRNVAGAGQPIAPSPAAPPRSPGSSPADKQDPARLAPDPATLLAQVGQKPAHIKEPDTIYLLEYDLPDDARALPALLAARHEGAVRATKASPSVTSLFQFLADHDRGSITDDEVASVTGVTATRKVVAAARKALATLGFPGAGRPLRRDRTLKSYSTSGLWPVLLPAPRERERAPPSRVREQ